MRLRLTILFVIILCCVSAAADNNEMIKYDYATRDGQQVMRATTPGPDAMPANNDRRLPVRNPNIMAQVVWVDRNHEFAIAENTTTSPDGSLIFAGWWLNNMRYSKYASAGLEFPLWRYDVQTPWTMPVSASNSKFAGTGAELPAYIWNHDSPLPEQQFNFDPGQTGAGVSYSGNGNLLAMVIGAGQNDAILTIYDIAAQDTVFTRHFVPTQGLYGVDLSLDGSIALVSCYGQLYVFEVPSGNVREALPNYSQNIAKVSANGQRVVNGDFTGVVYLYQWNGSNYDTHWIRATGHDWVTAVDISDDGSTVVCGTLDFVGQAYGGKFQMWDGDTGNELIDYDDYGDMVASVALSGTGQYAIAGSWGQYATTFGDVVTCFMRGSSVPIYRLEDDLDEAGSVFSVAISDSGHYAAAGGKGVHAREFGNGGMLYSIKIRDPLANDVAVASIDQPGEFLAPGQAVSPTATYINVGSLQATFATACTVINLQNSQVIYSNTANVTNLPSFNTFTVAYPTFTMPGSGRYRMKFSASMAGDLDPANNNLALVVRSWHDIQAVAVQSPSAEATVGWPITPSASFKNMGSYYENVDVSLSIRDSSGTEQFATAGTLFDLAPYAEAELEFEGWAPSVTGLYRATFTAMVDSDYTPTDNILTREFHVVQEMIYDDGVPEVSIWVDAYPSSSNRKFGQRFEPNIPAPFTVTNVRMLLGPAPFDGTLDYLVVTPELDGFPDTLSIYGGIDYPILPGPGEWGSYDMASPVTFTEPLWVVIHWPDDAEHNGPYIGADGSGTIDRESYWHNDASGWNLFPVYDWMIRMTLSSGVGVESDYYSGLPERVTLAQNYPNPFNPSTNIRFGLPNAGWVRLDIYDVLGRRVRTLINGQFDVGYHTAHWDGRTDDGHEAGSGVYYTRLNINDSRVTKKMLLVR
jgi:WD40 repeat protein